jgi:hypothetical protein
LAVAGHVSLARRSWRSQCRGIPHHHPVWPLGRAEIAAAGGADRRSAKNAAVPHGSIARSAPCGAAAPLPPRGHDAAAAWAYLLLQVVADYRP